MEAFRPYAMLSLEDEIDAAKKNVIASLTTMLMDQIIAGDASEEVKRAIDKVRIQARILGQSDLANQTQACELLGLSKSNPSTTMRRKVKKNEVLQLIYSGKPVYPLFQFELEKTGIYPAVQAILAIKPENWSNFRLLNWFMNEHVDFDMSPAEALKEKGDEVISAFEREIAEDLLF